MSFLDVYFHDGGVLRASDLLHRHHHSEVLHDPRFCHFVRKRPEFDAVVRHRPRVPWWVFFMQLWALKHVIIITVNFMSVLPPGLGLDAKFGKSPKKTMHWDIHRIHRNGNLPHMFNCNGHRFTWCGCVKKWNRRRIESTADPQK